MGFLKKRTLFPPFSGKRGSSDDNTAPPRRPRIITFDKARKPTCGKKAVGVVNLHCEPVSRGPNKLQKSNNNNTSAVKLLTAALAANKPDQAQQRKRVSFFKKKSPPSINVTDCQEHEDTSQKLPRTPYPWETKRNSASKEEKLVGSDELQNTYVDDKSDKSSFVSATSRVSKIDENDNEQSEIESTLLDMRNSKMINM